MRKQKSSPVVIDRLEQRCLFAAGAYDSSFAAIGYLTHSLGKTADAVDGIQQSDGKVVQVGDVEPTGGGNKLATISRYSSTGALDSGFASGGVSTWSMGSGDTIATGVAQQADNKLVVVGFVGSGTTFDMWVARFNTNGTLDNSFSGDGKLIIDFNGQADFATGVAINGTNIFISGGSLGLSGGGLVVAKVDSTGTLSGGFGSGGKATLLNASVDFLNGTVEAYVGGRMVIDSSGRPVIAGTKVNADLSTLTITSAEMGVCRSTTTGTPDPTFGGGTGFKGVSFNRTIELGTSVAIDSRTGKILLAGTTANGTAAFGTPLPSNFAPIKAATRANFACARFTVGGGKDTTFSGDGKLQIDFGEFRLDGASDIVVDSQGRAVLSGGSQIRKAASRFAACRLSPGGALDATFAASGLFLQDIGGSDGFFGGAIQTNGRYLFFGHTKTSGTRGKLVIVRLLDV